MAGGKGTGGAAKAKKAQKQKNKMEFMSTIAKRPAAGHVAVVDEVNPLETQVAIVDARRAMATQVFTPEALGMKSTKRMPTQGLNSGMNTVFAAEATYDVARRIKDAVRPLHPERGGGQAGLLGFEAYNNVPEMRAMMPKRPAWSYEMSSGRLHYREAKAFQNWLASVREKLQERGGYAPVFEQNLQVWRQLWRVMERADVVVAILDARNPLLHFPPALYYHVSRTLNKPLVLVLNKTDLVSRECAERWAAALGHIPGVSAVVGFSCAHNIRAASQPEGRASHRDEAGEAALAGVGKEALLYACHTAAAGHVAAGGPAGAEGETLGGGVTVPAAAAGKGEDDHEALGEAEEVAAELEARLLLEEETAVREAKAGGTRLMLGLVGHPNVGKSSVLNELVGEKVVAVKNTPGHTKILQTYILDGTTCLCDSPGVVFPRLEVPLEAQIVAGLVPLAQVREPFSAVRWLAENAADEAPLPSTLNIKEVTNRDTEMVKMHPQDPRAMEVAQGGPMPWSPLSICSQYARLRGFVRNDHPDVVKAGMTILRRVLDLRLSYSVPPPTSLPSVAPPPPAPAAAANGGDETDALSDDSYNTEDEQEEEQLQSLGFMDKLSAEARAQYLLNDDQPLH